MHPVVPQFAAAPVHLARGLQEVLGVEGQVGKKLPFNEEPEGYYRLIRTSGPSYFLKVLPNAYLPGQTRAEAIARALKRAGISVNAALDGFPKPWGTGHHVFAYAFVNARFAEQACGGDLRQLGAGVAGLHRAMKHLDQAGPICLQAEARCKHVGALRTALADGALSAPYPAAQLRALLEPDYTHLLFSADGQVLHGDLNYGNAIFPVGDGRPVILDFEDAVQSYGTPRIDLALVLERFVLVQTGDDEQARRLGTAFLAAYLEQMPDESGNAAVPLQHILIGMAQRSICLLAEIARAGLRVADDEWEKFRFLHHQARARASLLAGFDRILDGEAARGEEK